MALANAESILTQKHLRDFFLHSVRWMEFTSGIFGRWPKEKQYWIKRLEECCVDRLSRQL
jgi:hypothetical protein